LEEQAEAGAEAALRLNSDLKEFAGNVSSDQEHHCVGGTWLEIWMMVRWQIGFEDPLAELLAAGICGWNG